MASSKAKTLPLLGILACGPLLAQDFEMDASGIGEEIMVTSETIEYVDPDILLLLMNSVAWEEPETEIERAVAELVLEVAKNERAKIFRTESALVRHRWSSVVAVILAHVLLLLGLFFGILEFRQSTNLRRRGKKVDELEMSVSFEGIAVKSSLNGLLLLLLSFAFYLAFLRYVYPLATA